MQLWMMVLWKPTGREGVASRQQSRETAMLKVPGHAAGGSEPSEQQGSLRLLPGSELPHRQVQHT